MSILNTKSVYYNQIFDLFVYKTCNIWEYFMSTLQNVEKPTPWGCLVVASRFGQPEIQSTLKFVYERKRAGKKEKSWTGEIWMAGKERKLFRGRRSMHPVERGGRWRARVRLRKCADHFSGTSLVVSDNNNEDKVQWRSRSSRLLWALFHVHEIIPFCTSLNFLVFSVFREGKFVDSLFNVANIDETSHQ